MLIPSQAVRKLIEGVETRESKLRSEHVWTCFFYAEISTKADDPSTLDVGQKIVRALWKHSELDDKELLG